jgi:retron-type reverse transcriptase
MTRGGVTATSALRHRLTNAQLVDTFESQIAVRSVVGRDGMQPSAFRSNLAEHLRLVRAKVSDGSYRFSPYRQHLMSKGPGKYPRVVAIASVRDRLVLKVLADVLAQVFRDARSRLAPAVVASLIRELEVGRFDAFVRVDVEEFYPSIRHQVLDQELRSRVKSTRLRALILRAARTPTVAAKAAKPSALPCRGVPQGLPVSNILAEIAMRQVDSDISAWPDVAYFRYVDDILLLCKRESVGSVLQRATERLLKDGLKVHPIDTVGKTATGSLSESFSYLGYEFSWPRVSVRASSVGSFQDSLTKVLTTFRRYARKHPGDRDRALVRCRLWLDLKITGCTYEASRRGWISFYSQIRHQQLLHHLDWFVAKQLRRFGLADEIQPKSFVTANRFARRRESPDGYVPTFDNLSPDEMRLVLQQYFLVDAHSLANMADDQVADQFRQRMHRVVVELERDASRLS